jgi:hypothetical protein
MHDRAARPTGAVKSAAAIATEIMILLNINLRIARVRPRVEEKRSTPSCSYLCSCSRSRSGIIAKAFEVATNMLVVIMESSENHLKGENYEN